jgi:hypothetical protein
MQFCGTLSLLPNSISKVSFTNLPCAAWGPASPTVPRGLRMKSELTGKEMGKEMGKDMVGSE